MSQTVDTTARIIAMITRRAQVVPKTFALAPDPAPVFGIAPIRIVSEQRLQAVAYGILGAQPAVAAIWNALSRESTFLEPFAQALDAYITACLREERIPRVWLPHRAALDVVDILGHRYWRNSKASGPVQRLGWICRVLSDEVQYKDQQIVAVAGSLLAASVVTGQSPTEDQQLRALLAWIAPQPGIDPAVAAAAAALIPAAAMLIDTEDDLVEGLRRRAKKSGSTGQAAQQQIENILSRGALREWELLVQAWRAYWSLGLVQNPDIEKLVERSYARVEWALSADRNRPSKPHSLARLLDNLESATNVADRVAIIADPVARELARRKGRVFRAQVHEIRPGHVLLIHTRQSVLRIREGGRICRMNGPGVGRVERIEDDGSGGRFIEVQLIKGGMRGPNRFRSGVVEEWIEGDIFDGASMKGRAYASMEAAASPLAYDNQLPPSVQRLAPMTNLVDLAERLRGNKDDQK